MLKSTLLTVGAVGTVEAVEQLPIDGENVKLIIQLTMLVIHGIIQIIGALHRNKKAKKKEE